MKLPTKKIISFLKRSWSNICAATYSGNELTCLLAAPAEVLTLCTAIPKLPETAAVHPGGGGAVGEMAAVTAWGRATGFACTAAARARSAKEYCIIVMLGGGFRVNNLQLTKTMILASE